MKTITDTSDVVALAKKLSQVHQAPDKNLLVKYFGGGLFALCPDCPDPANCPTPCVKVVNDYYMRRTELGQILDGLDQSLSEQGELPLSDPSDSGNSEHPN